MHRALQKELLRPTKIVLGIFCIFHSETQSIAVIYNTPTQRPYFQNPMLSFLTNAESSELSETLYRISSLSSQLSLTKKIEEGALSCWKRIPIFCNPLLVWFSVCRFFFHIYHWIILFPMTYLLRFFWLLLFSMFSFAILLVIRVTLIAHVRNCVSVSGFDFYFVTFVFYFFMTL